MAFDIHGNHLLPGHCEVHPYVHEEYPCSVCFAESKAQRQRQRQREQYVEVFHCRLLRKHAIVERMLSMHPGDPQRHVYYFPKQADFIFQDALLEPEIVLPMIKEGTLYYVTTVERQGENVCMYQLKNE